VEPARTAKSAGSKMCRAGTRSLARLVSYAGDSLCPPIEPRDSGSAEVARGKAAGTGLSQYGVPGRTARFKASADIVKESMTAKGELKSHLP
jgi:hypothetical protein